MTMMSNFCILLFLIIVCNGEPMDMKTKEYLHEFGYLESMDRNDIEDMNEALKDFQYFVGMDPTGHMDEATKGFLSKPRCGMPDYFKMTSNKLNFKGKWENNEITYVIVNRTRNLNRAAIRKALEKGIKLWTNGTDLKMKESKTTSGADIKIYFNHQDGPGNKLGFAYYPTNGQMFLDIEEDWSLASISDKINFNWVTTHELGHVLGLSHIDDPDSIMNPYYQNSEVKLSEQDQKQISDLYRKVDNSDLCKDPTVDDLLNYPLAFGGQLLFQNDKYWTFTKNGLTTGPFDAKSVLRHFPGKIDAAVSTPVYTYLFEGNHYYRSHRNKRMKISKKFIANGFDRDVPGDIEASFYHPNGTIYLFKGSGFYAFNFRKGAMKMNLKNVKISSYFDGLPDDIEAATMLDGQQALFVKSGLFYVFDFSSNKIVEGSPYNISTELFKC